MEGWEEVRFHSFEAFAVFGSVGYTLDVREEASGRIECSLCGADGSAKAFTCGTVGCLRGFRLE